MLLLGGAGRNVGKTRLTCRLIRAHGKTRDVVGLKVTTVQKRHGACPRGGQGCGVCTSLSKNFDITEESGQPPGKDTSLMVDSGAVRVLWLRVLFEHLDEGAAALRQRVGPHAVCICESNSLRLAVEPDLFVIVKHKRRKRFKPSAMRVAHLADAIVSFDHDQLADETARFALVNNMWVLPDR